MLLLDKVHIFPSILTQKVEIYADFFRPGIYKAPSLVLFLIFAWIKMQGRIQNFGKGGGGGGGLRHFFSGAPPASKVTQANERGGGGELRHFFPERHQRRFFFFFFFFLAFKRGGGGHGPGVPPPPNPPLIKMYAFAYMLIYWNTFDEALNWVTNVLPLFICNLTQYYRYKC